MPLFFDTSHIDQILQSIDIVELISDYVALKPRGKEFVGLCPFHDDSRPSMYVSPGKQIFKCFACGAGGNAFSFLMRRENMNFPETVEFLADRAGIQLPTRQGGAEQKTDRNSLEALNRWAAKFFRRQYEQQDMGLPAREYVTKRGITEDIARQFGLGWAPNDWHNLRIAAQKDGIPFADLIKLGLLVDGSQGEPYDRFRHRLIFPVIDAIGRVIGFGGRTLGDDPAKYLNSPESVLFDKSRSLYGLNRAKDPIAKQGIAIIVEGYTDCMMAHQFGITNVVATLGTALTAQHAQILSRYADKIILLFDSDMAGRKATDRAIEIFFEQQVEIRIATLPGEKDPCDFLLAQGADAFHNELSLAQDVMEFKWKAMSEQFRSQDSINGRKRAVEEFIGSMESALAQGSLDHIAQGLVVNRMSKLLDIPTEEIYGRIRRRKSTPRGAAGANEAAEKRSFFTVQGSLALSEKEILEVLLNRPDLFILVKDEIAEAAEFTEPTLRRIAQILWDRLGESRDISLAGLLASCEEPQLSNIITDLAEQGAGRQNYKLTLAGALRNLQRIREQEYRQQISQGISQADRQYGEEMQRALLQNYQAKWKPDFRKPGPRV